MKKILCTAFMMLMLCSSAFAGNTGNAFSTEENIGEVVIKGMVGQGTHESIVPHFVDEMVKQYTPETHKQAVEAIRNEYGKITDIRLLSASRIYDKNDKYAYDVLMFYGGGNKPAMIQMIFVPSGNKYKVSAVGFKPVNAESGK